jgi:hypothetical protein
MTMLVDERGTSSTCPHCRKRVPKPAGRVFRCRHCGFTGHRDLVAGANIASRAPGGGSIWAGDVTGSRTRSRTVEPGTICLMCPRHGVTPGAAPITATPAGPLAGRGPPHRTWGRRSATAPSGNARITQLHPGNRANAG